MVRGNWQRRVEQVEARKAVAKQNKQKKDNRTNFKAMASNLIVLLEKYTVAKSGTLHVWTEVMPTGVPPIVESYNDMDDSKLKRASRSGSFSEPHRNARATPMVEETGGGASSRTTRKAHPRSKEIILVEDNDHSAINYLCRTHFFKGRCDGLKQQQGSKKSNAGGCRHVHYPSSHKTLGQILTQDQNMVLEKAERALSSTLLQDRDEHSGGMEMIYYFTIGLGESRADVEGTTPSVGQVLSQTLSSKACPIASIAYVAYDNELIFDRNQTGGLLVPDLGVVFGVVKGGRSTISAKTFSKNEGYTQADATCIPAAVLEYILSFLPEAAVATMALVCAAWHKEIGKSSSHMWRLMLDRRQWPHPIDVEGEIHCDEAARCFKMHYQVVRDVKAVKDALAAILSPRRGAVDEVEMVFQSFATRRKAPVEPNTCVDMAVWSPTEVLAAFSHDCSVRLFKAVDKGAAGGKTCRELINVCVDPYRKTTKVKTRVVAMALGDDYVGCLLHAQEGTKGENYILSIILRDKYLEAAAGDTASALGWSELEEGALNAVNIGDIVVNFMLSTSEVDFRLADFLSYGGDITDVEVLVSKSIVACGHGRFLIEASISIPDLDAEIDDGDDEPMIMLCRNLIVISASTSAVTWMCNSNPTPHLIPRGCDQAMLGLKYSLGGSRVGCSVVVVSSVSPAIVVAEIDATGQGTEHRQYEESEIVRASIISRNDGEWEIAPEERRLVALFEASIVAVDVLFKDNVEGSRDHRSVVSFYHRKCVDGSYHIKVFENCIISHMERIRDEHILLVCEEVERQDAAIDGAMEDETEQNLRTFAVNAMVLHIPTRQIIARMCLPVDRTFHKRLVFSSHGNTICVGAWWKGVVMTGRDIRAVGDASHQNVTEDDLASKTVGRKKKKKARLPTGKGKKDGFARGMSQSG
jgi:hypothetical protein